MCSQRVEAHELVATVELTSSDVSDTQAAKGEYSGSSHNGRAEDSQDVRGRVTAVAAADIEPDKDDESTPDLVRYSDDEDSDYEDAVDERKTSDEMERMPPGHEVMEWSGAIDSSMQSIGCRRRTNDAHMDEHEDPDLPANMHREVYADDLLISSVCKTTIDWAKNELIVKPKKVKVKYRDSIKCFKHPVIERNHELLSVGEYKENSVVRKHSKFKEEMMQSLENK